VDVNELRLALVSTVRKLTEPDKQEILKLYRESAETTSTLAERYGVSNSTISRLLKSTLPEDEYEYLVSLKRAARTPEGRAQVSYDQVPNLSSQPQEVGISSSKGPSLKLPEVTPPQPVVAELSSLEDANDSSASRRVRRRSSAEVSTSTSKSAPAAKSLPTAKSTPPVAKSVPVAKPALPVAEQLELLPKKLTEIASIPSPILDNGHPEAKVIAEMLGEELLDESEDLDDLDDDDLDDDDYEDDEDYDDEEPPRPLVTRRRPGEAPVQVLPLSAAHLPKTCYLVIDRSSELITRPLRDFGDLGQIPNLETQQRTLPVFDNHRVAKRFSTKRDRVIKVPDSKMLHKVRTHLQAKGITRLLIDGQVYSLAMV
jgi:hypothetical protein